MPKKVWRALLRQEAPSRTEGLVCLLCVFNYQGWPQLVAVER